LKVVYEFVVADRADSQLLAQSPLDQLSLPYFRCFGLDPANLAALYFLITDQPYCDTYLQQFCVLHHDAETCNSLVEMPQSLCDSLASLPNHWQDDFKRNVLQNLVELSKKCQNRQQSLMLKVQVDQREASSLHTLH
jgi:hypothetical protein